MLRVYRFSRQAAARSGASLQQARQNVRFVIATRDGDTCAVRFDDGIERTLLRRFLADA